MNEYIINILDNEGFVLMTIESPITTYDEETYAEIHVSPLLPVIAEAHGEKKAFYRIHKRGELIK
jgi:hypothetical protein